LRAEIERPRDRPPTTTARPARERTSEASLRQRLEALRDETNGCATKSTSSTPS
jgi:hypothetical protein